MMKKILTITALAVFALAGLVAFAGDVADVTGRDAGRLVYELQDSVHNLATGGTLTNGVTVNGTTTLTQLVVKATIASTGTVSGSGFKIGPQAGWSGVVTNSLTATNVIWYSGGIVTNVTRLP
jgi:hypothetical protein